MKEVEKEFGDLIELLCATKSQLSIGHSEIAGTYEITVVQIKDGAELKRVTQVLPLNERHAIASKVIDCAKWCISSLDKLKPLEVSTSVEEAVMQQLIIHGKNLIEGDFGDKGERARSN